MMNNTNLNPEQNFVMEIKSLGALDSFTFRSIPRKKPGPGEVEIDIFSAGLNFKDVLMALGTLGADIMIGFECAGKISAVGEGVEGFAVGDEVIAFGSPCFSSYVITAASVVIHKPPHLSFEESATIPVAFVTAYYALTRPGKLCKGERVLIHSAAGGVGLSAVKISQWIGAEIFATAGNNDKRAYLRSLGIEHVLDSRSLSFADQVMERTAGKGVDVVLNSLSGKFINKSLYLLAPNGRFLEIGMHDMLTNTKLDLRPFLNCLSYSSLMLSPNLPDFLSAWREVINHFKNRVFSPIPLQVFPMDKIGDAFSYMTKGVHMGKIVLVHPDKLNRG